jgi:hypothetical protein
LLEALLEKFIVVFPEVTQYPEIRTVKMRYEHKPKIFMAFLLYLTRTENPLAVSIYQDGGYSPWRIRILTMNAEFLLNA